MQLSRRNFFSKISGAVAVGALAKLLPTSVKAEERRRPRAGGDAAAAGSPGAGPLAQPLVDPNSDMGKAVKYVHNKADIKDAAVKMDRQGVKFDQQFCHTCSFYKEVGDKDGGKVGTCTIFSGKLVKANGFCTSWNKKA